MPISTLLITASRCIISLKRWIEDEVVSLDSKSCSHCTVCCVNCLFFFFQAIETAIHYPRITVLCAHKVPAEISGALFSAKYSFKVFSNSVLLARSFKRKSLNCQWHCLTLKGSSLSFIRIRAWSDHDMGRMFTLTSTRKEGALMKK